MNKGKLRQILLITDGQSNKGEDPVYSASVAYKQGITVNVIGILEDDHEDDADGLREIEAIAQSGGGISQIVYKEQLSQTVQMVTRQAMTQTLQGFINKELTSILGQDKSMNHLEPEKRGEVMEIVDDLGESCDLEVLILVDTSGSMRDKLQTVKEALIDLSISLKARTGNNLFSIFQYPSQRKDVGKVLDWSHELASISEIFPQLASGGITPTGPAIREAVYHFSKSELKRSIRHESEYNEEESWY